jgi:putative pyruvate formate lyase activating enzyme
MPAGFMNPYRNCQLCPRNCGVDRTSGKRGVCGQTDQCRLAFSCAHFGEEPAFTGTHGSGTLFFSGCACRCFFCQNHQISTGDTGHPVTDDALFKAAMDLASLGVHNLNFVTPDHFWPHIQALCLRLRAQGVTIPFVYNCSGYQRADVIGEVAQCIDIFLPDFKFAEASLALRCMGDAAYSEIALSAIAAMVDAKGFLDPWDPSGNTTACQGVLVRHLVMPGALDNSFAALDALHSRFGSDLPLSLMSQFLPTPACQARGLFSRTLYLSEYQRVCDYAEALGFDRVYIQPEAGDDDFMPDFEAEQVFRGNRGVSPEQIDHSLDGS